MTLKNVVKANIYLSDLSKDFNAVNEVCLAPVLIAFPSFPSRPFFVSSLPAHSFLLVNLFD